MKNQDLSYFHKGTFENIDSDFISDGLNAMCKISEVQRKYHKPDIDTVMNELHDAIVGQYLGFGLVNTEKHGFDCKLSEEEMVFLESKVASWSKSISATFNDTTLEKAEVFKDEKTWLALSVWSSASELMFICFGQNEKLGEYLEQKVIEQTEKGQRRTQTKSLSALLFEYDFKILTISKTKRELYMFLTATNPQTYKNLDMDNIIELKDFEYPYLKNKED